MLNKEEIKNALILLAGDAEYENDILEGYEVRSTIYNFVIDYEMLKGKETADYLIDEYADKLFELVNKYHSIELDDDRTIVWRDANGEHKYEMDECNSYRVWDIELFNYVIELGYDNNKADAFVKDVADIIGDKMMRQEDAFLVLAKAALGDIDHSYLLEHFPRINSDSLANILTNLISRYTSAMFPIVNDAFDELITANER